MRIVTVNTWKNEGDYPRRIAALAAGLRALAPDIVLLQEAFRTLDNEAHTARTLAEAVQLTLVYEPARMKTRRWKGCDVASESGLAILARGPIEGSECLRLPSDDKGGERIALLAVVTIDGAKIVAGCVHLSHVRGDHARRREQLETILAHPLWSAPAALRVLGGDCNATLDAPGLAWLEDLPGREIRSVRSDQDAAPTHPLPPRPDRPGRAIDHLFVVRAAAEPLVEVEHAGLALTEPIDGIFASDHAAVVADLSVVAVPPRVLSHESHPPAVHSQSHRARRGRLEGIPARVR